MVLTIRIKKSRLFKLSSICLGICFIFVPFLYYAIFSHPSSHIRQYEISMNTSEYEELNIQWNNNPRGVIVTLIRATNHSIARVINMIHSVVLFHSTKDKFQYPFLIFHDQFFTLIMREHILSCARKHKTILVISFLRINFLTNIRLPDKFLRRRNLGYHQMCRFWSYDVFYHPAIIKNNFDYLMRMDDDSYFMDETQIDLFQYIDRKKLDYIYRSSYEENSPALFPIEKLFINTTRPRTNCIYNNFFIIRLQWLYKSQRVLRFLHELVRDDLLLREYIGDGCVHAAMLDMDPEVKTEQLQQIRYGHNFHRMAPADGGRFYNSIEEFEGEMRDSCDQIRIFNITNEINRIKIG